jgi:hypothetical protein
MRKTKIKDDHELLRSHIEDIGVITQSVCWRFGSTKLLLVAMLVAPVLADAQTDEIQVYAAEIASPGEFTLTLHDNYTPEGLKHPAFLGGIVPDRALNGVPEWAYGATDWLELGLYLPVYTLTHDRNAYIESTKLRTLFVVPHADDRTFFYGINFEYSRNAVRWEPSRYSGEIRPIVGVRFGPVEVVVNPILDTDFNSLSKLDFAPETRLAYNFSKKWAVAVENYADLGAIKHMQPGNEQSQSIFAVVDFNGKTDVEFGIGKGLNDATSQVVFKLMLTWSLYHP